MQKFKELLTEEDKSAEYKEHLNYRGKLESLRFQKEEAIKKVTAEWNKKIEDFKLENAVLSGKAKITVIKK